MLDEIAEDCIEMSKRAKEVSKVRFYLTFVDDKIEQKAYALEYGNEKNPPVPFMRLTADEHEKEWKENQKIAFTEYTLSGDEDGETLVEICKEIADGIAYDYKEKAEEMNVPRDIIDGIIVDFEV